MRFIPGLSLALRSHDQFRACHRSPPPKKKGGPDWSPNNKEVSVLDSYSVPSWSPKNKEDFGIVPGFCSRSAQHRALKTRRFSRLDACIVPAFCSGSSPLGAFKTGRCSGLDAWIVPAFCSGSSLNRALETGRGSISDPNVLFSFLTQCYYLHTSRYSVSLVGRMF